MGKYLFGDGDPNYTAKVLAIMLKAGFDQGQLKPFQLTEMKDVMQQAKADAGLGKEKKDSSDSD